MLLIVYWCPAQQQAAEDLLTALAMGAHVQHALCCVRLFSTLNIIKCMRNS